MLFHLPAITVLAESNLTLLMHLSVITVLAANSLTLLFHLPAITMLAESNLALLMHLPVITVLAANSLALSMQLPVIAGSETRHFHACRCSILNTQLNTCIQYLRRMQMLKNQRERSYEIFDL